VRELASGVFKPCVFPFAYNNRVFNSCTDFNDPDGRAW
jgi:hypothetical protein